MPKKFKIKIDDGAVYSNEIPEDVEELEIDCKIIGKKALSGYRDLRSVKFINTEVISEEAFRECWNLQRIELPDTIREIGDRAFEYTSIGHLVIPPSITTLGSDVISYSWYTLKQNVLEIFLKEGKYVPFFDGSLHHANKTTIVVRSFETKEILYQFVVLHYLETVLTEHGIDFTEYDKLLETFDYGYFDSGYPNIFFLHNFEVAHTRILSPASSDCDSLDRLKAKLINGAENYIEEMIKEYNNIEEIGKFPYYCYISQEKILKFISGSVKENKPEAVKILLKVLSGKTDDITGISSDISTDELTEITNYSARLGFTELTALLMQKLHEKRMSPGQDDTL